MFKGLVVIVLCGGLLVPGGNVIAQTPASVPAEGAVQEAAPSAPAGVPAPLTPEERQSLEERSEEPGPEVAGGALTNQQLTYIVIALAAAVLVLVLK